MRMAPICLPCMLRQAITAAEAAGKPELAWRAAQEVAKIIASLPEGTTVPEAAVRVHRLIREVLGVDDPFAEHKRRSNEVMLSLLPRARRWALRQPDPLKAAAKLALAANIIDVATRGGELGDPWPEIRRTARAPLTVDHFSALRERLERARTILYLGDNAGECVMDGLLIEFIKRERPGVEVYFVAKSGPAINDATVEDAFSVGLDRVAKVIESGADAPGLAPGEVNPEVEGLLKEADIVIAKGQANFESLDDAPREIFFALKVKCPAIAGHIGYPVGSSIFWLKPGR